MTIKELDNIKIFFILGRPRSGTTLLRTLLDAHTNVSIPYEGQVIIDLFLKYGKIKQWSNDLLIKFYNDAISVKKVEDWDFNDGLKEQILSLGENANFGRLIKLVYVNFTSLFKKEKTIIIGDKNPYYSIRKSYLKIIKDIFPDAKIIHLVRDYRAHYLSMKKMDFENNLPGMVAYRWKYSYKIINEKFSKFDNYLLLKHEDITANPQAYLQKICSFLDIDYQDNMLEFYKVKDIALEKYGEEKLLIHSSLLNPISDKFNDRWKNELSKKEIQYLENAIGNLSEESGYKRIFEKGNKTLIIFHLYNKLYFLYVSLLDYFVTLVYRKLK